MLIDSPIFVCLALLLTLLVGWLAGNWWRGRVYDAVWRDGANWTLWYIRKWYIRLPRKLHHVLESTAFQAQGVGRWRLRTEEKEGEDRPASADQPPRKGS